MLRNSLLRLDTLEGRETPANISAVGGGFGELSRVQVFKIDTQETVGDFLAFGPTFTGGVNVAVSDVNLDGFDDLVVSAGIGGGPRVRVFDGRAFSAAGGITRAPLNTTEIGTSAVLADFFAFESGLRNGTFVTAGNLGGTLNPELIIGAGPGGGPRVKVLDGTAIVNAGTGFTLDTPNAVRADFFAGDIATRNGVTVAFAGNAQNPFLAVGAGTGGNGGITVLNGNAIVTQGVSFDGRVASNFVAQFSTGLASNVRGAGVSSVDFNNDGFRDLSVLNNGTVNTYSGLSILNQGTAFTGTTAGDVLNTFSIPAGTLVNGGFSNFGGTTFGGFGNFNTYSGFGGFNNMFGVFGSTGTGTALNRPEASIAPPSLAALQASATPFTALNGAFVG